MTTSMERSPGDSEQTSNDNDQEEAFRERIGDEPADSLGHDRYPGDSEEEAAERQGQDSRVPLPADQREDQE